MKANGLMAIPPSSATVADKTTRQAIDVQMLKDAVNIPNATDAELRHFGRVAQTIGLDPLKREIYLVKRWNPELGRETVTHQTGIDGFRVIAERTQQYQGQTPPQWCGADGQWVDVWLDESNPPAAARIGVYRADFREPMIAIAKFSEYCQRTKDGKPNRMWRTMPSNQIAKCAEALALRKAFPNQLGGLYTNDEMAQASNESATADSAMAPKKSTEIVGNIGEPVQESGTDFNPVVMETDRIVSHLLPFRETLGEKYYQRILREIGHAEQPEKIDTDRAKMCWRIFTACQAILDFQERIGADPVRETLKRNGYQSPQEIPTIQEFQSILNELRRLEVKQ